MALTVLLGGARSGKSAAAQSLAADTGRAVTYVATATPGDDEMAERIERHRADRPREWETIEEPTDLGAVLAGIQDETTVIVDCLTLWVGNMLGAGVDESGIVAAAGDAAGYAARRIGETIVVTNEVGLGIVPATPLGREFRDVAGRVNQVWVRHASRSGFVVAGNVLPLTTLNGWKASR